MEVVAKVQKKHNSWSIY